MRKLLELIMNLGKSQDTKSIYRSPLHSYPLTMKDQKEIKELVTIIIVTKIIEHRGVNLPKGTKKLYTESV